MDGVTGEHLKLLFKGGLTSLAEQQQEIDALNVFPVPDGDTGRNMYLTTLAAVQELEHAKTCSLSGIGEALAKGSLMGARGNSGVILSQLIRGFSDAVKGHEEITLVEFARAWQAAVSTAYKAVMKPVEGTMLTVARGFSQGLNEAARTETDVGRALLFAVQKGNETLQLTPELLPELKRAGVVDAGGKGLLVLLEGGLRALDNGGIQGSEAGKNQSKMEKLAGESGTRHTAPDPRVKAGPAAYGRLTSRKVPGGAESMTVPEDDFVYTYCIELLLEGGPACVNQLRNNLQVYGGSLIVGNIDELIKVHVHSNHPGQVLEYCQQHGSLHDIKINNMRDQWKQAYGAAAGRPDAFAAPAAATDAQEVGVVAVAAGEGIREIFRSLGAAQIIDGGQTMNPPVKEFVRAIEAMPQTQVLVLPNNKNLILAAEQAKGLVGRRVEIIATTGIQAGIAALLSFNPAQGLTANMERMEQAANRIKSAEVTYAVRDAVVQGAAIKQGSLIGLWQDEIVAVGTSLEQVVLLLVDQMLGDHDELVTLFVGEGVAQDEAGAIAAAIRTRHPGVTVEVQPGGQPVYHFLISVE